MNARMKRIIALLLTAAMCLGLLPMAALAAEKDIAENDPIPIYEDTSYSFEERAADLVARMSLAQKGSQMISEGSAAIPAAQLGGGALNVPATKGISSYQWWNEALHGYSRGPGASNATSYSQNLTAGSTWNPELYYRQAVEIGNEIRERTATNTQGNAIDLTFYSPTVNMQRDPRWGRNEETFSEDVLLNSVMGTQFVRGMEGKDENGDLIDPNGYYKTVSTVKHYTANNSERNRLDGGAVSDLRAIREYYTAPYRNIIRDADVSSVMTAYSTLNGEPTSMSSYLMDTLLRQSWGFSGYVTSDCDSVSTITRHRYVNPHTGKVLTATELMSQAMAHGEDLECSGGHSNGIGTYASNIATMVSEGAQTDKGTFTENQVDISLHRLMTARIKTGEFDDNLKYTTDAAARKAEQEAAAGEKEAYWQTAERLAIMDQVNEEGVVLLKNDGVLPLAAADKDSYQVVIVGAWQTNMYRGLYSNGQSINENEVNIQKGITDAIKKVNAKATVTYITSNTLTEENKTAIQNADAVIVVTGTDSSYSKEDGDRTTIALPNKQAELISEVGKLNEKTVAIMETCGPMQVTTFEDDVAAILWSSYGGIRKGIGFGNVISGAANPSGKLTATWHQNVSDKGESDIPEITEYNMYKTDKDSGRTYMYYQGTNAPSYPFGYGLSYTTFEYSNLTVDKTEYTADDTITVTVDVTNSGKTAGKEVVQLYVAQPEADAALNRPIKRLVGFEKIELAAGAKKTVTFTVKIPDLAYFNEESGCYKVDTGKYQIQVGTDSQEAAKLTKDLTVSGEMTVRPAVLTAKPNQDGDKAAGIEERLIFDAGKTVNPQLTLAMSDESLYGYIIANQKSPIASLKSTELPEGATVTYESNRPEVVKVEGDTITTVAPGVATITATLTLDGEEVSTEFVVYVESNPYLASISVDGTPIEGFRSDRMNYSVDVEGEKVPTITYTLSDEENLTAKQENAKAYPGVTTITVTHNTTGAVSVYRIGFGNPPKATSFKNSSKDALVAAGWTVLNPADDQVKFGAEGLTITTQQGDLASEDAQPKNMYMTPALGDWVAQSHISLDKDLATVGQQVGLLAYDDADCNVRIAYERRQTSSWWGTSDVNVIRAYAVSGGEQTQLGSATVSSQDLYFQIVKRGDAFTFNYSTDGASWNSFGGSGIKVYMAYPQIGLLAVDGSAAEAASVQATFDGIGIYETDDLYPRLKSLMVDGAAVTGFDAEKFVYNQLVEDDATAVPEITAEAAHESHKVEIEQLSGPTGTATVTVSSGAATAVYTLSYNYGPKSDYFADGDLNAEYWEILREDDTAYNIVQGKGIVMPTQRGDIHSTGGDWHNAFVMPAMGNWEAVAKVVYPHKPTADYQQAMMLVWQDEDNYIRVNCQQDNLRLEPGLEIGGSFSGNGLKQDNAEAAEDGTVTLYFKINKVGLNYGVSYSQDGVNYRELGTAENVDFANPQIGLFATQNTTAEQMDVYFEYLTVTSLNGVEQVAYTKMLENAAQEVADYVAAELPETTYEDITFAEIPHGYTLEIESSDPEVIAADGTVTCGSEEQKVSLTVTISDGTNTVTAEAVEITVQKASDVQVSLDKTELELAPGETSQLTATVTGAGDENGVNWTSSDEKVATVDEKGLVTAVGAGDATITATAKADGRATATCDVTVTAGTVAVTGVTLDRTKLLIAPEETAQLTATVQPDNATIQTVSWTSSDEEVATVDESGLVTAVAEGSATITVTTDDNEKTATCEVTVQTIGVHVESVEVTPDEVTLEIGETEELSATVKPENADCTDVNWSTSNPAVATVENGVVTAVGAGTADITVTTVEGGKNATCKVTVTASEVSVTGISLDRETAALKVGGTVTLKHTITPENATNQRVTWTSSDDSIATVKDGVVTGVAKGEATITVTTEDGEKTASCVVTVSSSSGGSSGGSTSKPSQKPTEPSKPDETVKPAPSGTVTVPTPTVTPDANGEAKTTLSTSQMSSSITEAANNNNAELVIEPAVNGDASKVSVEVTKASIKEIASKTDAALTVKTEIADVKIPASSLDELSQKSGGTVTISTEKSGDAVKVEVKVDNTPVEKLAGGVVAEVPAATANNGNVLVIVHADGSETIVKKSVVDGNTVVGLVDGSCTVKVATNSKVFADTAAHWAKDAVAFVASRELFQGVSANNFAPNAPMNRAMLATVLYRLEDAKASGSNNFADVAEGTWYNDAVTWASQNGIVTGTGTGFNPNGNVTREQLATMLYRYAKSLGMDLRADGQLNGFTDGSRTSDWAKDAMVWAVSNGLITGRNNGVLDPSGSATRAEVAAIMQRMVGLMVK